MPNRKRVLFIQRKLPLYRLPFFEGLKAALESRGIDFDLLVGDPTPYERDKGDAASLPWAIKTRSIYLLGERLCWNPVNGHDRDADLVIVSQENKLIYNHLAITVRRPRRLAFFGHGRNLQSDNPDGLKERYKAWTTRQADWWFAYTERAARLIEQDGFPRDKITVFNNAVDDRDLRKDFASLGADEIDAFRREHSLGEGPTALFLGSLHDDKRLDFLVSAAIGIRAKVPGFSLLIVGDGPAREQLAPLIEGHPWIRWVGRKTGREKALSLAAAQLMLNPGLVGLSITDGFVAGLPMLTTNCGLHSPEIEYLEDGVNGLMIADDLQAYVDRTSALLLDPVALQQLRTGALASASVYTLEGMIDNLARGIEQALKRPARH